MDSAEPRYLGGEIEGWTGQDRNYTTRTTALWIPEGVEHGKVSWKAFEKTAYAAWRLSLTAISARKKASSRASSPPRPGECVKYAVDKPLREVEPPIKITGRTNPTLTYMSNKQVPAATPT